MQIVNANNRKEQVFINYGKDTVNPITLPKMPIINHYTFRVGNGEGELEQLFHKITTATKAYPEGTNNYVKQDDLVYNQPYCFVEVIITQLPPSDRPKCYMLHNQYVFRCNFSIRKDESLSSNPTVYFCDKLFSRGTFQGKDFEIKDNYIIASSCITKEQIWDESENKFSDLCFRTRISFEIDGVDFMPENFDVLPPLDYKENDNKVYELTKFKRRELLMFKLMGSDSVVIRNSCMKLRSSDVTNIIIYNVKHALIENCNLANENCFDPEIGLNEKYPDVKPGFNRDGGILWFYGDSENVTVRNNIFYKWGNDEALTFYGMNYFYGYIRRNVHVTDMARRLIPTMNRMVWMCL